MIKDIKLSHTDRPDKWDWTFIGGDLFDITGTQQLVEATRHAVLLKPSELLQVLYTDKGNKAWDYIYHNKSSNIKTIIRDATTNAINNIEGVNNATIELDEETHTINPDITILTDNLEIININDM